MSKTKVTMTPDTISNKWNRNMKNSISDIQAGVNSVSESPMEKAIAKQDKMLQNITRSISDGRWSSGLRKVTLSDWKTKTAQKVGERLAGGVDASMPKRKDFDSYLVNTLNGVLPSINSMPDMTIEDGINKVRALVTHLHNNPYKK